MVVPGIKYQEIGAEMVSDFTLCTVSRNGPDSPASFKNECRAVHIQTTNSFYLIVYIGGLSDANWIQRLALKQARIQLQRG